MYVNKTHYKLAQKKPNLGFTQISCLDTQMRMLKCYQNPDSLKIEINTRIEILSGVRVNSEHLVKLLNGKNENDVLIQNATG